jgi:hypothetical protein
VGSRVSSRSSAFGPPRLITDVRRQDAMSFIPQCRTEWIQQTKLAVFVLALFGYVLFLMEGLSTGLGVYRDPTYCWIAGAFALLALLVASRSQRWVALAALVAAILVGVYGCYANATWRERLKRVQTPESAYVLSGCEVVA